MSDLERVALERDDARELHREVVRSLVRQVSELRAERDRALACEAAALALLAEWRERVASPPPEGERCGERKGIWACDKCGCGNFEDRCIRCGSGRSGGSR